MKTEQQLKRMEKAAMCLAVAAFSINETMERAESLYKVRYGRLLMELHGLQATSTPDWRSQLHDILHRNPGPSDAE